jgi:negative regulator of sigma E activity
MRRRGGPLGGRRGPGLIGTVARTAVVAGTASAVVGGVSTHREAAAHQQQAQVDAQVTSALAGQQAAAAPAAPAAPAAAGGGLSAESITRLQQLGDLVKQGILTDEEFAAQKARLLGT